VRILFEVEHLQMATPATSKHLIILVSRCGMVWFPDDMISAEMLSSRFIKQMRSLSFEEFYSNSETLVVLDKAQVPSCQILMADALENFFGTDSLTERMLKETLLHKHIMEVNHCQIMHNLFSLLIFSIKGWLLHEASYPDLKFENSQLESYIIGSFYLNLISSLCCGLSQESCTLIGKLLMMYASDDLGIKQDQHLIDFNIDLTGKLILWKSKLPNIEIDANMLRHCDIVIPTVDTLRNEKLVYSWLSEKRSILLCGPPGSGKVLSHLIQDHDSAFIHSKNAQRRFIHY
jgi:dynein heavy chain 1